MMTREQIVFAHPIIRTMEQRGHSFITKGKEATCICPFHADNSPSFRVNVEKGAWFCDPCGTGGSVIDLIMKLDGLTVKEAMEKLGGQAVKSIPSPISLSTAKATPVKTYSYTDANGKLVYEVIRYEPKTFRQRRPDPSKEGAWLWDMTGISRILYRLPEVLETTMVCIVEGEKDADNLTELGMVATCSVGGAGKWLDAYSLSFADKDVILCGDNDKPGREHMEMIAASLAGKVKSLRRVTIPEPHKDVSDFIASMGKEVAAKAWMDLCAKAKKIHGGIDSPIQSIGELEPEYKEMMGASKDMMVDLSRWLPSLRSRFRLLMPGEVVAIVADTSAGKTAILQNIAIAMAPLPTLLFELELPGALTFERFVALVTKKSARSIEEAYMNKQTVDWRTGRKLDHIFVCSLSKMTPQLVEKYILEAPLKMGKKPVLVMIDYLQIMRGDSKNRYEKASEACEDFKSIAKSTGTVIMFTSQISRKKDEVSSNEVFLHDGKDSGSIESSAGVVLGAWRDQLDDTKMFVKVCKQTKGPRNFTIPCRFDGETMGIKETF